MTLTSIKQTLEGYQKSIDCLIQESIPLMGGSSRLRDACDYALSNGGKRFRPALVLLVGDALNVNYDISLVALAIEYFHTASLIADDLPCMDDDDERRNKPSLHIAFGESTAIMASYALISAGYGFLAKNAELLAETVLPFANSADSICRLAVENVSYNTGLFGATGGQYLDMQPSHPTFEDLREIALKKTASLFEISFVLGWLYAGGDFNKLPLVKKTASHFGLAFQIADDIGDMDQDQRIGKSINFALVLGLEAAKKELKNEIESYCKCLSELQIATPELLALTQYVT